MILYQEVEREEITDRKEMYRVVDYLGQHSVYLKPTTLSTLIEENTKDSWISVEDRLPEDYGKVLLFYKGYVNVGRRMSAITAISYKFTDPAGEFGIDATHWQPLPS